MVHNHYILTCDDRDISDQILINYTVHRTCVHVLFSMDETIFQQKRNTLSKGMVKMPPQNEFTKDYPF